MIAEKQVRLVWLIMNARRLASFKEGWIKDKKNMFARNSRIPKMLKGKRVFVLTEEGDHFFASLTYAQYDNVMDMLKNMFNASNNEELAKKIGKTESYPNPVKSYSKLYDD